MFEPFSICLVVSSAADMNISFDPFDRRKKTVRTVLRILSTGLAGVYSVGDAYVPPRPSPAPSPGPAGDRPDVPSIYRKTQQIELNQTISTPRSCGPKALVHRGRTDQQ
jgi:hypothetical protein